MQKSVVESSTTKDKSTSESRKQQRPTNRSPKKKILLIRNSHLKPIRTYNFVYGYDTHKIISYSVQQSTKLVDFLSDEYDCIVVHLFTNDLRVNNDSEDICNNFQNLIVKIHTSCPKAKIIISSCLLVNKADTENVNLNEKVTYCNLILRHRFLNSDYVEFCDNSSLNERGKPNPRFLSHDNIHLNGYGIIVFVTNLKDSIYQILIIRKPSRVQGRQNNKHTYNSFERRYYRGPFNH